MIRTSLWIITDGTVKSKIVKSVTEQHFPNIINLQKQKKLVSQNVIIDVQEIATTAMDISMVMKYIFI